jgi:chaperonin GroES
MVKPIRNQILVSKKEAEEKTASGLFMPQIVDEKVSSGEVVAVGSGHLTSSGVVIPLEVQVGDKVVFNKNMAVEINVDGKKLLLLREDNLYCVL